MIIWLLTLPLLAVEPQTIEGSIRAEIERAMTGLKFPDQPSPHYIAAHLLTGESVEIWATDGALVFEAPRTIRSLRTEVRVGKPDLDSGNFDVAMGRSTGTYHWGLAHEDEAIAIRKGLWISMDKAYKGATETYAAKLAARRGRDLNFTADFSSAPAVAIPHVPQNKPDQARLRNTVLELTKSVADLNHLEINDVAGHALNGSLLIQDSAGTQAWLPLGEVVIRAKMTAIAADGSPIKNNRSWVAKSLDALPSMRTMADELQSAAQWIKELQHAEPGTEYLGPVLFEPEASAELFRQLLQPQISGTPPFESAPDGANQDARPIPTSRIGRRVLPSGWSVTDNPQQDANLASYMTHDFEGVESKTVEVVKEGVVRDVLMSRTPRSDKTSSTGHARNTRSSRFEAMPSQVTVRNNRSKSWSKLRRIALSRAKTAGLSHVLVIRKLTPPALTEALEFSLTGDGPMAGLSQPIEAYRLYSDGREEPVRGLEFVGVDRRVLRDIVASGRATESIEMLDVPGSSRRYEVGWFEGLPVAWSVPPILIDELELHGRSGGEPRIASRPQ